MSAVLALLVAGVLMFGVGDGGLPPCERAATCQPVSNLAGFLVGSIAGVVVFGLYIEQDNTRRAAGSYRDHWFKIKPRSAVVWITLLAWALGLLHWYGFALHLSRLF